jgi:ABC-type transport system involved in cytochrome bd biosynthesis fused ATPase/permease subunit
MAGKTTIIISHDLELIRSADHIMVIRHGRIEETGRHHELLREGGLYAALYSRRFGEADEQLGETRTTDWTALHVARKRGRRP